MSSLEQKSWLEHELDKTTVLCLEKLKCINKMDAEDLSSHDIMNMKNIVKTLKNINEMKVSMMKH